MKNKIILMRDSLERNKIFFEILTAVVLTFTSIYVSVQANNISRAQTGIMKLENTPRIEIRKAQLENDSAKIVNVTKWLVINNNSKISNFEIEKQFSYINVVKRKNSREISIPLMEYINIEGKSTGKNEGLVFEFDNANCSENEFLTREKIWDYGYIYVKSFIAISYDDVLTKKETKYYQITPLIQEISKIEWELISTDWSNKSKDVIHLKDIEKNIQKIKNYR